MRYVKRRKRKRYREDRGFFTISVIVCGLLIYAFYASSAGKWIMDNYIAPVFNETEDTAKTDNVKEEKQSSLSYEGFTLYSMQTGAYSDENNAKEAGEQLKKNGGAGYVYFDGMYRVLAFCYEEQGDADTVKKQLKEAANVESSVYTIAVPSLDLKVTGEDKNVQAVDNAFKEYLSAKDKLGKLVASFDKGEVNEEQVMSELQIIIQGLSTKREGIDKLAQSDDKLKAFNDVMKNSINVLEEIKESDNDVLSAQLKNGYIDMVCKYSDFVKRIKAQAKA